MRPQSQCLAEHIVIPLSLLLHPSKPNIEAAFDLERLFASALGEGFGVRVDGGGDGFVGFLLFEDVGYDYCHALLAFDFIALYAIVALRVRLLPEYLLLIGQHGLIIMTFFL